MMAGLVTRAVEIRSGERLITDQLLRSGRVSSFGGHPALLGLMDSADPSGLAATPQPCW